MIFAAVPSSASTAPGIAVLSQVIKVTCVPFPDGKLYAEPKDFLTGFMPSDRPGIAYGRPGVPVDLSGALLVADDVGNTIWRVTVDPPH